MSNRDPDTRFDELIDVLRFFWKQGIKMIHTSIPAIVHEYEPATRRATVQPAIRRMRTKEGAKQAGEMCYERPLLVDVPVLQPAGGGYILHMPVEKGDLVMLHFCERGISNFKKVFELADPPPDAVLSEGDAVAYPGWSVRNWENLETETGLVIQNLEGTERVVIDGGIAVYTENGDIVATTTNGDIELNVEDTASVHVGGTGGEELATKTFVRDQYNAHTHAVPQGGLTGPPITAAPMVPGSDITKKQKSE